MLFLIFIFPRQFSQANDYFPMHILIFSGIFLFSHVNDYFPTPINYILKVGSKTYRERLNIAGTIHSFQRDTDETLARIKEKLGKNLPKLYGKE